MRYRFAMWRLRRQGRKLSYLYPDKALWTEWCGAIICGYENGRRVYPPRKER